MYLTLLSTPTHYYKMAEGLGGLKEKSSKYPKLSYLVEQLFRMIDI